MAGGGALDGALRRPRRVERRNAEACSHVLTHSFRPLSAGGDSAAPGNYTFSAVATGNGGLTATNSITVHVVTP